MNTKLCFQLKVLLILILPISGIIYWDSVRMEALNYESPHEYLIAEVTAYSEKDSCHYPNCEMASGKKAYIGALACPRNIELGTFVLLSGILYECEDRTNKSLDGRFDIFFGYGEESYQKALRFGLEKMQVVVLNKSYQPPSVKWACACMGENCMATADCPPRPFEFREPIATATNTRWITCPKNHKYVGEKETGEPLCVKEGVVEAVEYMKQQGLLDKNY